MIRFSGEERFPYPRSQVVANCSDAAFLARCAPNSALESADRDGARWRAESPFRFVAATIFAELTITGRTESETSFSLANSLPAATLNIAGWFRYTDESPAATLVTWQAEVVGRTGLLKMVPAAVLRSQIEAELVNLWRGVRAGFEVRMP